MVRLLALLIAANLAWAAWSQGWLRVIGLGPQQQTEPERLARQVRPEALRIEPLADGADSRPAEPPRAPGSAVSEALPTASPASAAASAAQAPASASAPASAPASAAAPASAPQAAQADTVARRGGVCLQAGTFDDKQIESVRRAAAATLPAGSWRVNEVSLPGRWMVYLGKLADAETVRVRRAELRARGIDTDHPGAAFEPGLSLGRFSNEETAQRALTELNRKGVRAARVVQERRDTPAYVLRLPSADAALRQQARGLQGALGNKTLHPCE